VLRDNLRDDLPIEENQDTQEVPKINKMVEDADPWPLSSTAGVPPPLTLFVPGDALPSHGGAGTVEVLQITKLLEDADICCCVVGISALRYFGAWRVRHVS
jgi:hypothetical protein